jgi:hypothetical protein
MTATAPEVTGRKFITTSQLCARWGDCSHMTVERKLKFDPSFPRPYHFTRVRMFDLAEIEAYERGAARSLPQRERA